ncbi:hypothetical protein [Cytophaga aurantiaca]|uniref:hypothetical protein n=1 Tax=Cytophaga aurantiaca TaxID=29530 RepID=UPI00036EB01C|nr:hypothetical protein [Cytophaga aurantiaca]
MKKLLFIFAAIFFINSVSAQDTIKVEPSVYYESTIHQDTRSFYGYVQYAREDILYFDSLRSIQYCYYMDSVRKCIGSVYQLKPDNVVLISTLQDTVAWMYRKYNDSLYEVNAVIDGFWYSGWASSVMPLQFKGELAAIAADRTDTLWYTTYAYTSHFPQGNSSYRLNQTPVKGKIYKSKQCDLLPRLQDGSVFAKMNWEVKNLCYNDPYYYVSRTVFVVTAEGRIRNISRAGNLDLSCSDVYIDFVKTLYKNLPLMSATRKGKPVNIQWEVLVDMKQ